MATPARLLSYLTLLGVLSAQLIFSAILPPASWARWLSVVLVVLSLTVGAWAASATVRSRVILVGLAVATSVGVAAARTRSTPEIGLVALLIATALLVFVAGVILRDVLSARWVDSQTVAGGICVYLLVGTIWSLLFLMLEVAAPDSFAEGGAGVHSEAWASYFSLVTLSTLGYGDIVPLSRTARVLAVVEAVIGQLYLAVLIGRLVGLHRGARRPPEPV